jgi:hypothetical protein
MRSTHAAVSFALAGILLVGLRATSDGVQPPPSKSNELEDRITDFSSLWKFGGWVESKPKWRGASPPFRRECTGSADCTASSPNKRTTEVTIAAAEDAAGLNLDAVPVKGVVVARMDVTENAHDFPEKRYGLDRKKGRYYLVIDSEQKQVGNYAARRWYLVRLRNVTKWKDVVADGWMRRCGPTQPKPATDYAGFSDCSRGSQTTDHTYISSLFVQLDSARAELEQARASGRPTTVGEARIAEIYKKLILAWINPETGPIWISCTHGCCVAEE